MRLSLLLLVLVASAFATADRLIQIPVGKKIPHRVFRVEAMFDMGDTKRNRVLLGMGLTKQFDLELMSDGLDLGSRITTFDASYIVTTAIVDLTPGISIGIKDALDETADRRRLYIACTWRSGTDGNVPIEVSFGAASHRQHPLFVGVSVPFVDTARLLVEHDTEKITAGAELIPFKGTALRLLFREDRTLVTVAHSRKF